MRRSGRATLIAAAALMVPFAAEAQPRSGIQVQLAYHSGPDRGPYVRCRPGNHRNRIRCRAPRPARVVFRPNGVRSPRATWVPARLGRFHMSPPRIGYGAARMERRGVERVLGRPAVRKLARMGRSAGLGGRITGVWTESRRHGASLLIRMGGHPIAELNDYDWDGRADEVRVPRYLRRY